MQLRRISHVLVTNRTIHRVAGHRITFGAQNGCLEFRIVDAGGGFISGRVSGDQFLDIESGSTGPNSEPAFTPQRREALVRALAERKSGEGQPLEDRDTL